MQKIVDAPAIPHNIPLPLNGFRVTSLTFLLNDVFLFVALSKSEFIGCVISCRQLFSLDFFMLASNDMSWRYRAVVMQPVRAAHATAIFVRGYNGIG